MIIGLVGFIGSGKGTIADLLCTHHGFIKESFAAPGKDAASVIFGWDRSMLEGDTPKSREWREKPDEWWSKNLGIELSPRKALQLLGTESGRHVFGENLWVLSLKNRIKQGKNYVVADVRFPNEIAAIREIGGKIVRVQRGSNPIWYTSALHVNMKKDLYIMAEKYPEVHYSEWAWIGQSFDYHFDNNCQLYDLPKRVDNLASFAYNNTVEDYVPNEVII